jgi:hypothetical protein
MDRQLSFQERCEAFAARRGRFFDMREDKDTTAAGSVTSLSTNPTIYMGKIGSTKMQY